MRKLRCEWEKTLEGAANRGVKQRAYDALRGLQQCRFEGGDRVSVSTSHARTGYSPEAVAEHAMALAMAVNRHLHKAYMRVRENNFSLQGLTGMNFYGKTAGIVGTGKIGAAMARICHGFGMKVIAYDMYQSPDLDFVTYVELDELLATSDLISLHCPLMESTHHMINIDTINKMKDGVILVNTSRGGLVKTDDLIAGIRERKFFGVGLDVYEEETQNVYTRTARMTS
ncbi:MAG: NAD(P)-dependent oxidoreductase [Lachnospiraceae bacterium]